MDVRYKSPSRIFLIVFISNHSKYLYDLLLNSLVIHNLPKEKLWKTYQYKKNYDKMTEKNWKKKKVKIKLYWTISACRVVQWNSQATIEIKIQPDRLSCPVSINRLNSILIRFQCAERGPIVVVLSSYPPLIRISYCICVLYVVSSIAFLILSF